MSTSTSPVTGQSRGPSMGALLDVVDELASRRPIAVRLVMMTGDDRVGSRELAATLVGDVALTSRVMRLANSGYYGLGGRVGTPAFAVTVIGTATVRAMAAVAAAGIDAGHVLPADFWPRSKATATACSQLAPRFSLPPPDAFCLGLLSGLGQAILVQHDPAGYLALLASDEVAAGGREELLDAEAQAYGFRHPEVSAAALSSWNFPPDLAEALHLLDSPTGVTTPWSLCLATAVELAERLSGRATTERERDVAELSQGSVSEEQVEAMLPQLADAVAASDW